MRVWVILCQFLLILGVCLSGTQDEMDFIRLLHERIVRNHDVTEASDMQPYREQMEGSDVSFDMVPISGGTFLIGSPEGELGRKADEGPQREVRIEPFWMGMHEVTWDEYDLFTYPALIAEASGDADAITRPTKPYVDMSFGMGHDGFPAISMTHHAAVKYCQWLSAKTNRFYRLPTEAEWECACRAGTT